MNSKTKHVLGRIAFYLLYALIVVWMLFPFYWAINSSLKSESQLQMTPATFVPRDPQTKALSVTLQNYGAVFRNESFVRGLINSVIVAVSVTVLALAIGAFAAFALGKLRFRGKTPSLYLILAMTMFPQVAVLSGLYALITFLGISARPSMIVTYMLFTLPFTVWVLTSFFRGLPLEIMQSAQVDGATPFQTFYMILLPLTMPALVTTGLLAFIAAWNEYLFALTFTSIEPTARTVPVAIALFTGEIARQEPFGEIMAAGILVSIPLVILVLIFQQRIISGLTAGAVKG
jgi:trehalose/maltose transport system permease protein